MINEIIHELRNMEALIKIRFIPGNGDVFIAYLICLKYLCEKGLYDYYDAATNEELFDITPEITLIRQSFHDDDLKPPINNLLLRVNKVSAKKLLLEYLDFIDRPISLHQKGDKIAYLNLGQDIYRFYNSDGGATYFVDRYAIDNYKIFQVFDEILGIENYYELQEEKNIKDFNTIYVHDDASKILRKDNRLFELIRILLYHNDNVVLFTNYNKISNFRNGKNIAKGIKLIILEEDKATIQFQLSSPEITIINYDKNKIKDQNQLASIIHNNKKQKGLLIKIHIEDLIENNYRIGFNLYQLEKTSKVKDINKIVDENTKYLDKLNQINQQVEREINKLLNK